MNKEKREAIEKLVEKHNGVWPNQDRISVFMLENGSDFVSWIEFTNKAKELGYVNGYKYGVEYPTNGKKPDLPDDVVVDVKCVKWSGFGEWPNRAGAWNWHDVEKFKITDERYKPKDQPVELHEMDNWHERGEFPSEGVEVEVLYNDRWVGATTVGRFGDHGELMVCAPNGGGFYGFLLKELRPIQSERDKVIETAMQVCNCRSDDWTAKGIMYDLYNAGILKLSEEN